VTDPVASTIDEPPPVTERSVLHNVRSTCPCQFWQVPATDREKFCCLAGDELSARRRTVGRWRCC